MVIKAGFDESISTAESGGIGGGVAKTVYITFDAPFDKIPVVFACLAFNSDSGTYGSVSVGVDPDLVTREGFTLTYYNNYSVARWPSARWVALQL